MKNKKSHKNENNKMEYPIRINRYLYLQNICSRRQADRYIEDGLVFINGVVAKLGQKIESRDVVTLDESIQRNTENVIYLAYNKPRGIVSHNPQAGERGVLETLQLPKKWWEKNLAPMGRLDKESTGLMLLSDDGRIVNRLLNPSFPHEKEYVVTVDKKIRGTHLNKMERGVNIEGYQTKPTKTELVNERTFRLILTEGKKHQIRRMCAALGYQVKNLKRIRIKNIELDGLKENNYREIQGSELDQFLDGLL